MTVTYDELRERLAAAVCEEELADFRAMCEEDRETWLGNADRMLAEFGNFMGENGLKITARPEPHKMTVDCGEPGLYEITASPKDWDDAPPTPWKEEE